MSALRDYQSEDVERIFKEWEDGARTTLYSAATGLGKTRVMCEVATRFQPKRTLLLAHRDELITQAWNTFKLHDLDCEIEKAEQSVGVSLFTRPSVVIASVQTLLSGDDEWRRMQKFDPKDFGLLLYDEAHHSVSKGNKKIVDYFCQNPDLKVLGVTATPDRADEQALGEIFETVASERDILWAKQNGWLVDIEQYFVPVEGLDFSHVRTTAGDLNGADLAAVMEAEHNLQETVHPTLETLHRLPPHTLDAIPVTEWTAKLTDLDRRRAIVFTVSVAQAEMLCNIFNRVVPGIADWVCGKTADEERKNTFARFKTGITSILVNCGVTTEGYDNPAVDMIVMARPTKSRSLYAQMVGRGTRALPGVLDGLDNAEQRIAAIASSGKPCLTVLDFVGNSGKHKLMTTADILGDNVSDEAVEVAIKKAKAEGKPVNVAAALEEAEEEVRAAAERARQAEEARKARLVAKVRYGRQAVNPFDALDIKPARSRGWDAGKQLSEKQKALLAKQGLDPEMEYAAGRALLNELFRRWHGKLATYKQVALLKRFGYDDAKDLTMEQAKGRIDRLAANNWQRPEPLVEAEQPF